VKEKSIIFSDRPSIVNVGQTPVIVHFLADAQGTFFIQYDPRETLADFEQDIYFMGEPGVGNEQDVLRLEQIIKKYHMEEIAQKIMLEQNYINYPAIKKLFYLGDRLAEEFFLRQGCTREEMLKERAKIAEKVYYLRNPEVIKEIQKQYPGVKITIVSQAGQYMKGAFESLLDKSKTENVGVIVAPGYMSTRYTKLEPELYSLILENNAAKATAMIDDNEDRLNPARKAGVKTKLYVPGKKQSGTILDKDGKVLLESSEELIDKTISELE
jgi:phosphoglycolate phosphatase-like HAD superfamily hydrolase